MFTKPEINFATLVAVERHPALVKRHQTLTASSYARTFARFGGDSCLCEAKSDRRSAPR